MRRVLVVGLVLCWWAASGPLRAQNTGSLPVSPPLPPVQGRVAAPVSPEASDEAMPPYEFQLERLADVMGTLAYMRDLCGRGDGAEWRSRMAALIEAEGVTDLRRARLAGAFNHGFRGYEATYRICTPAAELVIRRSADEGDRLARELSGRFGGG